MKLIILIALFAAIGPPPKEPTLFLGHAQYQNKTASWCVVRSIKADSHKQADSLFRVLVDELVKKDKATLTTGNYEVWKHEEEAVLQIIHDHKLKPFSP